MSLDLAGRSVYITGAGSGIGKSTAFRFAAAGAKLFLVGRTESKLVDTQKELLSLYPNVEVAYATVDLADKKAIDESVKTAAEKFGGLSIVVANAGVATTIQSPFEAWEEAINTNITSVMYLSKVTLPHLEESVKAHGHASLIVVSSVFGFTKHPLFAPYVASKHGVSGFTLSLFEAVKNKGIKVTVVNPALTDTPMGQGVPFYTKKTVIPVDSIAHTIHFAATFPDGGCPTEITVQSQYSE